MLQVLFSWILILAMASPREYVDSAKSTQSQGSANAQPSASPIGDTTWDSLVGSSVVISAYGKGPSYAGKLHAVGEHTVVLVYDDGKVVEIVKAQVQEVRLRDEPPASDTAAPPPPARGEPTSNRGGDEGESEAPEHRPRPKRVPGNGKLFVGGVIAIAGGLALTIGGGIMMRKAKEKEADFSMEGVEVDDRTRRRTAARRITGTAFVIVGPVAMLTGAIMLTVAIVRRKKAREGKLSLGGGWVPGGGMLELTGRF